MEKGFFFIIIFSLAVNIGLGLFLILTISRHRLAPGAGSLIALTIGAGLWSFGYSMEFLTPDFAAKVFWGKFQYLGIITVPMAWFSFGYQSLGAPGWLERSWKQKAVLAALPLLALVLIWTNELHHLIWRDVRLQAVGAFYVLAVDHGPVFWLYLLYSYCLIGVGSIKLAGGLVTFYQPDRWRTVLRLAATVFPLLGNLIYVTGLNPVPYLDWSSLSFTIAGLLMAISLYRFSHMNILPIAQRMVFAVFPDCLFVLDAQNRLVDMNAAALDMVGSSQVDWRGKPLAEIIPDLAHWVSLAGFNEEFQTEISQKNGQEQRYYDLRILPLTHANQRPIGCLVVYHNITQHRQAQVQLEQVRTQLEEAVAGRTAELRWAVKQLQVELAQRTMAEQRLEDLIEAAPDAMLLVDQAGTIMLVNAQTERLFGYSRAELLGENIQNLVVPKSRKRLREHVDQFISDHLSRQVIFGLTLSALCKDGSLFPAEISFGALNTSDGVWIACNARDITERKKAEEEQSRLMEKIQQSREQLRALAVRLSEAQEYEQRQIAVELHDRVGQNLTGLNLNLQVIQNLISAEGFASVHSRLEDSMRLVEETTRQVRSVMADLNPPLLEEYGLGAALRFSCEKFQERTGIETTLLGEDFQPRLAPREEMALFRIVQEALNNVVKHAQAARVEIRIETTEQFVMLCVEDNGRGFNVDESAQPGEQPHWGLLNIRERAASIGGVLQIHSVPGQGTILKIVIQRGELHD